MLAGVQRSRSHLRVLTRRRVGSIGIAKCSQNANPNTDKVPGSFTLFPHKNPRGITPNLSAGFLYYLCNSTCSRETLSRKIGTHDRRQESLLRMAQKNYPPKGPWVYANGPSAKLDVFPSLHSMKLPS